MNQFWNKRLQGLSPYVPGEQPQDQQYIKLNTNESPYPPSAKVLKAMHAAVDSGLQLYPDPNCALLKSAVAHYYACDADNVFVGNGSDEVLAHVFAGLFDPERPVLTPDISYSFYPAYGKLYGQALRFIALDADFKIDLQAYDEDNGGVIFANPNAPTGIGMARSEIEAFLQKNTESVVVVDEAYVDFGGQSAAGLIAKYPNLLVTQTLSKSRALAGLRVGFALGSAPLIEGLERVKNSFNSYPLDQVALAGAVAAIQDEPSFLAATAAVVKTRDWTVQQLAELDFKVLPSSANFVFATHPKLGALALYQALKEKGVLVRHFDKPRIDNFLRISVGTDSQMQALINALSSLARA